MTNVLRAQTALANQQLQAYAPSVFAREPWQGMSAKYTFIPTIAIVDQMRKEGFQPVSVVQSRTRIPGKSDFTKHMIRFRDVRNGGDAPAIRTLGQIYPELVLVNSHDGASAYKLDAGLFRLVCLNGMVVSAGNVAQINVRHSGSADGVIDASYQVVEQFPKVLESVEQFAQLRLNPPQREAYADAALALKSDNQCPVCHETVAIMDHSERMDSYRNREWLTASCGHSFPASQWAPITAAQLVAPRRAEDREPSLWNTFNTAQENLLKGGLKGRNAETRRRVTTRPVSGISEDIRLNKALWTLTARMAELVSGVSHAA